MLKIATVIWIVLILFDFFKNSKLIAKLQSHLLTTWVMVEEIPTREEISIILAKTRRMLKRNIWNLVACYLFIDLLLAINLVGTNVRTVMSAGESVDLTSTQFLDFISKITSAQFEHELHEQLELATQTQNSTQAYYIVSRNMCIAKRNDVLVESERVTDYIYAGENKINTFVADGNSGRSYNPIFASTLVQLILIAFQSIIGTIALIWTLYLSVAIMKIMEPIRSNSIVLICIDFILSLFIPILVSDVALVIILHFTQIGEYATILSIGISKYSILINIVFYVISTYMILFLFSIWISSIFAFNLNLGAIKPLITLNVLWIGMQINTLATSVEKIIEGKINEISYQAAAFNWMIGCSILFSSSYLVVVAFFLVTKRWPVSRWFVGSVLQFLIEHPKGPISAAATIVFAIIAGIKGLLG